MKNKTMLFTSDRQWHCSLHFLIFNIFQIARLISLTS